MRPIQVCLSISKEMHDYYQDIGLDDQIFREAAEMLGRKLLKDGILERHLEPDINRPEFHYILVLNRKDLPEPKPMNIPSAGSGAMGTIPPKFKLDAKPEQPVTDCHDLEKGLEEEVKRYVNSDEYINTRESGLLLIARHFAEWGADHLRDSTKMVPEELEEGKSLAVQDVVEQSRRFGREVEILPAGLDEAAWQYAEQEIKTWDSNEPNERKEIHDDFIVGAEWDRAKMMEKAVVAEVVAGKEGDKWLVTYVGDYKSMLKVCKTGDKVKIIVIPEKSEKLK